MDTQLHNHVPAKKLLLNFGGGNYPVDPSLKALERAENASGALALPILSKGNHQIVEFDIEDDDRYTLTSIDPILGQDALVAFGIDNRRDLEVAVRILETDRLYFGTVEQRGAALEATAMSKIIDPANGIPPRGLSQIVDLRAVVVDKNEEQIVLPAVIMERGAQNLRRFMAQIENIHPLRIFEALKMLVDIGGGIDHMHTVATNLNLPPQHGDVKPANIIRRNDGSYFLADFGELGIRYQNQNPDLKHIVPQPTPGYRLPEGSNSEIDLYALVITLCNCLTGGFLKDDSSSQLEYEYRLLEVIKKQYPGLEKIVNEAMGRQQTNRFTSCLAFAWAVIGYFIENNLLDLAKLQFLNTYRSNPIIPIEQLQLP